MATIRPFRAFRYDLKRVAPADVITQPYDKITPAMQQSYYAANPYNLIRIILGRREASDSIADNVYTRSAASFHEWRASGILKQDEQPSLYACRQRFTAPGSDTQYDRHGFIALGKVEDYAAGIVHRHEQTLAKPKADRLELLRATRAHFEQLLMLYEDSGNIDSALDSACAGEPALEMNDEYGVHNRMWRVSDPSLVRAVVSAMKDTQLVIADGHHRYETAITYRDEQRVSASSAIELPSDFVPMTLVNMKNPGVVILPTHRVVHSLPSFDAEKFCRAAETFFNVEDVDPAIDMPRAAAILRQAGRIEPAILGVSRNRAFLIHKLKPAAGALLANLPLRQQFLDVSQLHRILLENVLGLSEESIRNQQNLSYIRDGAEAMAMARSDDHAANVSFLMNPSRIKQVCDMAYAGEVMPQKSTDFYPKLLSGLSIYALD